ncbi:MAG: hypothetical protein J6G98_02035 [Bacilli bacterium]|nr:hypothetical protein [Bacilli bacterium]
MNTIELNENINQYFEYIKSIYLSEFDKYISKDIKNTLLNISNVIELRDEMTYKVHVHDDRITFNLDLKKYIEENKLKDDKNLSDLSEDSKRYVKYVVDNENNVFELLKGNLLKSIILLFTKNRKDVVTLGTVEMICDRLKDKYNLPHLSIIPSKELKVAEEVGNIIGKDILIYCVVNRDIDLLSKTFDSYSNEMSYKTFTKNINSIYENYYKKIGKVYLPDSLYEYEKIDYKLDKYLENVKEEKNNDNVNKLNRLKSIKMSLASMYSHIIIYSAFEQRKLENSYNAINSILKNNRASDLIDEEYDKILAIENNSKGLINPIWNNFLNKPNDLSSQYFNYLVSTKIKDDVIEARLVSSDMIDKINKMDLSYGFICNPKDDAIINVSTTSFNYKLENGKYIIDNKNESFLQTPNMIISANIKQKKLSNLVLLDKNKVSVSGVFCFVDDELDNCSSYLKASVLAEDYNIPLIAVDLVNKKKISQKVAS